MKPKGYQVFSFFKNVKGLNTRDTATGAPQNSASDLLNVDFDTTGAIRKRRGSTLITDSSDTTLASANYCVGAIHFRKQSDSSIKSLYVIDNKIYKMDDYDGVLDDVTGAVSLTADQTYLQSMCISRDTVIGTNFYDVPWKYTGSGNASNLTISEFTNAKFCFQYKNRLVFANTKEGGLYYRNRLRWSNINTIETYTSSDYTDGCETDDGSDITGYCFLGDDVYIFKNSTQNGIKKLYYTGNATSPFAVLNVGGMGTISPNAIVQVEINGGGQGIIYYGMDGKIYFFDGNISRSISDHIQPTLSSLTNKKGLVCAANYRELNQVWFSYSSTAETRNTHALIYDYYNNAFLLHDQIPGDIIKIIEDTNNIQYLVGIGKASGRFDLYQMNNGYYDADDDSFNAYYWTAWLDLGDASLVKKFRCLDLYVSETGEYNLNVCWSFNLQDGEQFSRSISLSSGAAVFPFTLDSDLLAGNTTKIYRMPMVCIGKERLIRLKFYNNTGGQPFTLYRFDIHAKGMGQKSIT